MKLIRNIRKMNTAYEKTYVITNNTGAIKFSYNGKDKDFPGTAIINSTSYLNVELDMSWIPSNWTVSGMKIRFYNSDPDLKYLYLKKANDLNNKGSELIDIIESVNGYWEIELSSIFDCNYGEKKYITLDGLGDVEYEEYNAVLSLFREGKSELEPQFVITYFDNDKYIGGKRIGGKAGNSLSYSVNLLTGKGIYKKRLCQIRNSVLPINLELLINENNVRFTYDQSIVSNEDGYEYEDGHGLKHQFVASLNDGTVYYDTAGTGLILTKSTVDYTISDDNDNYLSFDRNGKLDEIVKYVSNNRFSIKLMRDSEGRLTSISESEFFENDEEEYITTRVNISYSQTSIVVKAIGFNDVVVTKDEKGNVINIIEEDNRVSMYSYNEDNMLITAKSDNGEKVYLGYDECKRVISVVEKVVETATLTESIVGSEEIEYHNLITYVRNYYNVKTAYVFNEDGELNDRYEIVIDQENNEEIVNLEHTHRLSHSVESNLNDTKTYFRYNDVSVNGIVGETTSKTLVIDEEKSKGSLEIKEKVKYSLSFIYSYDKLIYFNDSKTIIKFIQGNEIIHEETLPYVKHKEVMHRIIFETKSNKDIEITIHHTHVIGSVSVKLATLSEMRIAGSQTVILGDLGGEEMISIDNGENKEKTVWYSLMENTFTYGGLEIKVPYQMYEEDLEQNLKNIGVKKSGYNIWYNKKRGLVVHTDNVKLVGSKIVNLEEIKMGKLTVFNNQYYLNYSDYSNDDTIDNYLRTDYIQVIDDGIITLTTKKINKNFQVVKEINEEKTIKENVYDSYGNIIKEKIYKETLPQTFIKNYSYNKVTLLNEITYINGTTAVITYTTDPNTGLITKIEYPNGLEEVYEYVAGTSKLAKIKAIVNGEECSNTLTYEKDKLVNFKGMNNGLTQSYDKYNMVSRVRDEGRYLISNNLNIGSTGIILTKYLGLNNYFIKEEYDKYGNIIEVSESNTNTNFNSKKKLFYSDKDVSKLANISDPTDSNLNKKLGSVVRKIKDEYINDTASIYYDNTGMIKGILFSSEYRPMYVEYLKDKYGRINEINEVCLDTNTKQRIEYKNGYSDELTSITMNLEYNYGKTQYSCNFSDTVVKDVFGRISREEFMIGALNGIRREYKYLTNGENTTNLIDTIKIYDNYELLKIDLKYTYDNMGRIKTVYSLYGNLEESYEYDLLGRLVRENNKKLNKTYIYFYDSNGNITVKQEGVYTTETFIPTNTYIYEYSPYYSDFLTKYNNKTVSCSNKGNITQIGLVQYNWTREKYLSRVYNSSYEYTNMSYDADGVRIQKVYYKNGTTITHNYVTNGRKIIKEIIIGGPNEGTIYYMYHGEEIVGLAYKNRQYYFQKNLQGDIIEIWDSQTYRVAKYVYDAWGNHKVYDVYGDENTSETFIGNINPFRYRGYYYDVESNLFYVTSRYYSPELGRFIQPADVSSLNPSSINGLNLYSYANNNPIGIVYSSSGVGFGTGGGIVSSITLSSVTNGNYLGGSNSSGGSGFLGNLISGVSTMHGVVDSISSYLAGSVDGLISYIGIPKLNGFQGKLNKYSNCLMGIGIGLDIASSAYNNYMNPNLNTGQKWASFGADVGYIAAKSGLSYLAGTLVNKGSVALGSAVACSLVGASIGGLTIGFGGAILIGGGVVVLGIVAGTILIAVVSDALDNWWEKKKEEWFN